RPTTGVRWPREQSSASRSVLLAGLGDARFHVAAVFVAPRLGVRFEANEERRLRVRSAHQAPAVIEEDARAVDVDDLFLAELSLKLRTHLGDDVELDLVGAVDADLGRDECLRQVAEQLADGLARARVDLVDPQAATS